MTTRLGAPPRIDFAASRPNEHLDWSHREDEADLGFNVNEIQSVARRQLTGSIVVGLAIAAVAMLTALRPSHPDATFTSVRNFPVVERPIIIHTDRRIALTKQSQSSDQPSRESP